MRDLEPNEFEMVEKIRDNFFEVVRLFNFKPMEPSPIELLSTLEAKSGPSIKDEIYCFKDKGGRDLGLRFDLTVGLTRFVASRRELHLPIKLCSFSSMWRYDEPQFARYRWFYQWDAEIFGIKSVEADAEIIELTNMMLDRLGLRNSSIEIGDRTIVEEYVKRELGTNEEVKILEALRALDKVTKQTVPEVLNYYSQKGIEEQILRNLFSFGSIRGEPNKIMNALREKNLDVSVLESLVDSLKSRGVTNVFLNMGVVRGLDYYTGTVFEVFDEENKDIGALAGGGRYNRLPTAFGRPELAATGVAGGVERIMLALSGKSQGKNETDAFTSTFVAYTNKGLLKEAIKLVSKLRRSGVYSDFDLLERSFGKQLSIASSLAANYVIIIAPNEYSLNEVIVKDMKNRTERRISLNSLVDFLRLI